MTSLFLSVSQYVINNALEVTSGGRNTKLIDRDLYSVNLYDPCAGRQVFCCSMNMGDLAIVVAPQLTIRLLMALERVKQSVVSLKDKVSKIYFIIENNK